MATSAFHLSFDPIYTPNIQRCGTQSMVYQNSQFNGNSQISNNPSFPTFENHHEFVIPTNSIRYCNDKAIDYEKNANMIKMEIDERSMIKPKELKDIELLSVTLPLQRYKTVKVAPIPFDKRLSHDGRFDCLDEAFVYIAKHCLNHHNNFTKHLARMYLPFCRVMSFEKGMYIVPRNVKKKDFESSFIHAVQKIGLSL